MAKIALVGYGKMGKMIEQVAKERGHEIVAIIDQVQEGAAKEIHQETLKGAQVAIDFTHPTAVIDNMNKYATAGIPVVMGTTGWYDRMHEMQTIVNNNKMGFIWSGNFSIGMNLFFRVIEHAAAIVDPIPQYDVMAYELHHNQKKDSPSGTAEMIGKILLDSMTRKKKIVTERLDRAPAADEIHLASVRGGSIPGTHTVLFDSPFDTIEVTHTARTREGFALGAVIAAEFIIDKKGFYGIEDLMNVIIQ